MCIRDRRSDAVQMRFVYMWPYQNEIVTYANKNNIDPFLVAAVIKNESGFKPGAVSPVGADVYKRQVYGSVALYGHCGSGRRRLRSG